MKRTCKYCDNLRQSANGLTQFTCEVDDKAVQKSTKCDSFKRLTSFDINKTPTYPVPVLGSAAAVVDAGSPITVTLPDLDCVLAGVVTDADNLSEQTYKWTCVPAGLGVCTFDDDTSLTAIASFDIVDEYTLTLTADDGVNTPVSDTVVVSVVADVAPVVTCPNDYALTMTDPDDLVHTLVGSAVVEAGETSTLAWTQTGGAGTATFTDNTVLEPEVTFDVAGAYTLTLTATDAAANTDNDSVIITVSDKIAPTVDAGDNEAVAKEATIDLVGVVENEGDEIVYAWTYAKDGAGVATIADATAKVTTATVDIADHYTFTLTVDDQVNAPVADSKEVIAE